MLQEREVERPGAREVIQLDVRACWRPRTVTCAKKSLPGAREDLFYRLNVFLLAAGLRDRPRDILPLARHLMQRHLRSGEVLPPAEPEAEARLGGPSLAGQCANSTT